jgi:predicted RNase H-like nuclease
LKVLLIGVDLAWGEKKHDGVCLLEWSGKSGTVLGFAYPQGDRELMDLLKEKSRGYRSVFVTVDAPIVCPNQTGTRPVDRLTHRMFHREHAACHPANWTRCPRPPRLARIMRKNGFLVGWEPKVGKRTAAEVYPHPAMVRMFGLPRIVKYKKGSVLERRKEFGRLQQLIRKMLREKFQKLAAGGETERLLRKPWTKPVEDQTDALFCALIGLWHWMHQGRKSEVIGDKRTGFILLPESPSPCRYRANQGNSRRWESRGTAGV